MALVSLIRATGMVIIPREGNREVCGVYEKYVHVRKHSTLSVQQTRRATKSVKSGLTFYLPDHSVPFYLDFMTLTSPPSVPLPVIHQDVDCSYWIATRYTPPLLLPLRNLCQEVYF